MSEIVPFMFEEQQVRVVMDEQGEPWFVGADVCNALALANSRDALARLDDDEKGVANADTPGGSQRMTIVSEPGVYRLVFTSRTESAERFKRWVAHEVLPSIRKTGSYTKPGAAPAVLGVPATYTEALQLALQQALRVGELQQQLLERREPAPPVPTVPPRNPDRRPHSRQGHLPWAGPIKS